MRGSPSISKCYRRSQQSPSPALLQMELWRLCSATKASPAFPPYRHARAALRSTRDSKHDHILESDHLECLSFMNLLITQGHNLIFNGGYV